MEKEIEDIVYLGEREVDILNSPFSTYTKLDWVTLWITKYGQVDGAHHKAWVLDQVMQIVKGGEIILSQASWSDGQKEWRFSVKESPDYLSWIRDMLEPDENGIPIYEYDKGIAP